MEGNFSQRVVEALLDAFPGAAKEENPLKSTLLLHKLCDKDNPNSEDVQALIDKYPDAVSKKGIDGRLPLHKAVAWGASAEVIRVLLKANPSAAEKAMNDGDEDELPLHFAVRARLSLDTVKALLEVYPDGLEARFQGKLPLSIALKTHGVSDDVVLAILAAYPDAAKDDTGSNNQSIFPLHIAIKEKRSLGVVKALLEAYPKGAESRMTTGFMPLSSSLLTDGVSDDVALAILAAYPDAAKDTVDDVSPLHIAIHRERSQEVIKALLDVYPGAAEEKNKLPLLHAIHRNASEEVILLLFNAYPQAAKKKIKDGRLPIEVCAENKASENLMVELLKAHMPLRRDGTPVDHGGSWTACVASKTDGAAGAVRRILSMSEGGFGVHIHALADTHDADGRSALGVALSGPRAVIYEYLLFSCRYKLQNRAPEHRTPTSVVLRAQDLDEQADYGVIFDEADKNKNGTLDRQEISTLVVSKIGLNPELFLKGSDESTISKEDFVGICKRQLGDGPRDVVIKLMQKKDQWERECNARKEYDLDSKYVVSTLPNIPSEHDIAEAVSRGDGGLDTIVDKFLDGSKPGKYAIVMDAADRNLHQIFYQEQPEIDAVRDMLKQVFEAVRHLHEKNLMHGDIKMLNIVRFRIDNRLRLIDLDASAKIVTVGEEGDSFAGAKFSSAILPPEMIERIDPGEQVERLKKYWEGENDEVLSEKVAPKIYKEQGIEKAQYVVKSFRTDRGGGPVYEGLPYDLVKASENIDAWALGALAFTLLTGKTLIPSTRDDDCASGAAMHLLYSWGKQPEVLIELFRKIDDDAARDLIEQLLQREPEKRPTIASLLETHPFFHPERDNTEMKERLERFEKNQESQVKQLEIINANIAIVKKLGDESKAELFFTRHVLFKAIFEATEVSTPTSFIVLNNKLLPEPSDEQVKKILDIVAAEDGSGVSFQTKYASLALSTDGADIVLEGDLKKYRDQVEVGMKWAKRIKSVGANVADGQVGKAFEIINEGIKDLIVGNEMYLYLIDELTGKPVRAKGWPIKITKPSEIVPKLLPLMQVGMRAMSIYNGAAGVARMFGYPAPKVPKSWSKGAQESVELLKQESSVEQFGVVHAEVKGGTEEEKSVRGASLREFMDFMKKNDPGLKNNKSGDFAGLQRIGDPEDGTALWTTLTDKVAIENSLKERASQRKEENQSKYDEHKQKMTKVEVMIEEETKERISKEVKRLPAGMTSNEMILDELRKLTKGMVTADQIAQLIDARNTVASSGEIAELIKAAKEATAAAEEAAAAAVKQDSSADSNDCCTIM